MADTINITVNDNLVEIEVTGKLTKETYAEFVPVVEGQLKEHGKVRMLFSMRDYDGWTAGALWEDIKFGAHHWKDIERLALVGEKKWQERMAVFCKPFTRAKVEYFDQEKIDEARQWVVA